MQVVQQTEPSSPPVRVGMMTWLMVAVALAMWIAAVCLPVWETMAYRSGTVETFPGVLVLILGWLGFLSLCPAWLANIALPFIALPAEGDDTDRFHWAGIACALATTAYAFAELAGDDQGAVILTRLSGFYLWLGSFYVLLILYATRAHRESPQGAGWRWLIVGCLFAAVLGTEAMLRAQTKPIMHALRDGSDPSLVQLALTTPRTEEELSRGLTIAMQRYHATAEIEGDEAARAQEMQRRLGQIEALIGAGAEMAPTLGRSPLHLAACAPDDGSLVRLLIRLGQPVNQRSKAGDTPLDAADLAHNDATWDALVEAGGYTSRGDRIRVQTARHDADLLHGAVMGSNVGRVRELLKKGVDPNGGGNSDRPAGSFLLGAVRVQRVDIAEALLAQGAAVGGALAHAAAQGDRAMLEMLLSYEPDPETTAPGVGRPLDHAILGSRPEVAVPCLVAYGVNLNETRNDLPLNLAVNSGNLATLELLLKLGADPNATDKAGRSALAVATSLKRDDMIAALRRAGAR